MAYSKHPYCLYVLLKYGLETRVFKQHVLIETTVIFFTRLACLNLCHHRYIFFALIYPKLSLPHRHY